MEQTGYVSHDAFTLTAQDAGLPERAAALAEGGQSTPLSTSILLLIHNFLFLWDQGTLTCPSGMLLVLPSCVTQHL